MAGVIMMKLNFDPAHHRASSSPVARAFNLKLGGLFHRISPGAQNLFFFAYSVVLFLFLPNYSAGS